MLLVTGKVQACNSCLASLSSPASCYFRRVCYVHRSQAQPCRQSTVRAPLPQHPWHLKTCLLSCGFSNHTRQQEEGETWLPHQDVSMKSSRRTIPRSVLSFFQLVSADQNLAQSGCPATCNEHLCPAMTNGPSEIATGPASETAFVMFLTCWVLSPMLQKQQRNPGRSNLPSHFGFMSSLKQMQDRSVQP